MKSTLLGLVVTAAVSFGILSIQTQPAAAAPIRYEAAYVFGDSLSDPGNLFALTGEPPPPYFEGRVSDGPIWADYLAADFAAAGQRFRNYAFASARINGPWDEPIHLDAQLLRFAVHAATERVPQRSAALVWIGANDSFRIVSSAASQILGGTPKNVALAEAELAAQALANRLLTRLRFLAPAGIRDLVLFNLPDLGRTPNYSGTEAAPLASLVSSAFNARLAMGTVPGVNVRNFDVAGLFDALIDDPEAFGVSSLEPCFVPGVPMLCADPQERAFFDPIHPSAVIHARLADEVRTVVAPIPLPAAAWFLLTALAGLGMLRLRAKA